MEALQCLSVTDTKRFLLVSLGSICASLTLLVVLKFKPNFCLFVCLLTWIKTRGVMNLHLIFTIFLQMLHLCLSQDTSFWLCLAVLSVLMNATDDSIPWISSGKTDHIYLWDLVANRLFVFISFSCDCPAGYVLFWTLDVLRMASVWRVKEAHVVFIHPDSCTLVCQLLSLLFQQLQLSIKEKQTGKK